MFNRKTQRYNSIKARLIPVLAIFLSIPLSLSAQLSGGGYAESYLYRNTGARPIALGGAYTAVVNDPDAIFYNPAGIGFFENRPLIASAVSTLGFGRAHATLAWAQTIHENVGIGFGINSFNSGSFQGRDIMGRPTTTLQSWQYSFVATGSYRIQAASIGASVRYLKHQLSGDDALGEGYAFDVGTKFNVLEMFSVGIAVNNISGIMFWNTAAKEKDFLPYTVRAGFAFEYGLNEENRTTRSALTGELQSEYLPATRYVLVAMDAVLTQNEVSPSLILGVEAALHELIAFRGGMSIYGTDNGTPGVFPMNIWGGGLSLRPKLNGLPFDVHLDYTISNEHLTESGIGHSFALLFLL